MRKQIKTDWPVASNYKAKEDYIEKIRKSGIGLPMVYVEGGEFMMGATPEQGEDVNENELPVHKVALSSFHIGKYPVTQAQYKAVMVGAKLIKEDKDFPLEDIDKKRINPEAPVESVSWYKALEFCDKLSAITGKKYVLPIEAQWEFAARGGNKSKGYKYSGSDDIDEVAWFSKNSDKIMHTVGTKAANELGIYDMSGNVWEWCADWYGDYSSNAVTGPTGPNVGFYRVIRGGSYAVGYYGDDGNYDCRVASRFAAIPYIGYYCCGFRVVCLG